MLLEQLIHKLPRLKVTLPIKKHNLYIAKKASPLYSLCLEECFPRSKIVLFVWQLIPRNLIWFIDKIIDELYVILNITFLHACNSTHNSIHVIYGRINEQLSSVSCGSKRNCGWFQNQRIIC